jgi:hypothetical protein
LDVFEPYIQGGPGQGVVYLSWGAVDADGVFTLFRRAKLFLAMPIPPSSPRPRRGRLVGRLGLTDSTGQPICAHVRPPAIQGRRPG